MRAAIRKIVTLGFVILLAGLPAADRHEERMPTEAEIQAAIEAFRAAGWLSNTENSATD